MNAFQNVVNVFAELPNQPQDLSRSNHKTNDDSFSKFLDKPDFDQHDDDIDSVEKSKLATVDESASRTRPNRESQPSDSETSVEKPGEIDPANASNFFLLQGIFNSDASTEPLTASANGELVLVESAAVVSADEALATLASDDLSTTLTSISDSGAGNGVIGESLTDGIDSTLLPEAGAADLDAIDLSEAELVAEDAFIEAGPIDAESNLDAITDHRGQTNAVDPVNQSLAADSLPSETNTAAISDQIQQDVNETPDTDSLQQNSEALSAETGSENSLGNNRSGDSGQAFSSADPIIVSQNNESVFSNSSAAQNFSNTIAEVSQRSAPVESLIPTREVSPPTSQLKVAILANAASIEGEPSSTIEVDLHPAELGRLQVRIEQTGDTLHAKIIATEIASSELLLQDRQHLIEALNELGFGETSLDISHGESGDPETENPFGQRRNTNSNTASNEPQQNVQIVTELNNSVGINFVA